MASLRLLGACLILSYALCVEGVNEFTTLTAGERFEVTSEVAYHWLCDGCSNQQPFNLTAYQRRRDGSLSAQVIEIDHTQDTGDNEGSWNWSPIGVANIELDRPTYIELRYGLNDDDAFNSPEFFLVADSSSVSQVSATAGFAIVSTPTPTSTPSSTSSSTSTESFSPSSPTSTQPAPTSSDEPTTAQQQIDAANARARKAGLGAGLGLGLPLLALSIAGIFFLLHRRRKTHQYGAAASREPEIGEAEIFRPRDAPTSYAATKPRYHSEAEVVGNSWNEARPGGQRVPGFVKSLMGKRTS